MRAEALNERLEAVARFSAAQEKSRVPGSPILENFVRQRQAERSHGQRIKTVENNTDSSVITRGTELFDWMTSGISGTGIAITEKSAMRVSAVYACVNLIGGALASLPLHIYRRNKDGRERVDHPLWDLLNVQPHAIWTAAVFREYSSASELLVGDSFAIIHRPTQFSRNIESIEPVAKSRVTVKHASGQLWYWITDENGTNGKLYNQADVLHIPGPGFDGKNGMSQIRHSLRNSAGIALAADDYSAEYFRNGAKPDFALEYPTTPTPEQQAMIRDNWSDRYQGIGNRHKPALLAGGVKLHELTMNAEDSQLIATRQFQVEDIARIFGVPPHMIGHTEKSTSWGTGVEQLSIGFVKYTLQRRLIKFEQEYNRKLLTAPGDQGLYCKFSTSGLERGDYKTRNEGYRIALGRAGEPGWMTVNEVRKLDDLPPVAGGDELNTGNANAQQTLPAAG